MILGRSVDGRAVTAVRCAGAQPGPVALIFGGIHGDEPDSVLLCEQLIAAFAAAPPPRDVVIIAAANPDGLARGHKNNARDVDLNRNFDARNWQRASSPGYDAGSAPLSEPETQILARTVEELQPDVIVSVHQPLRCVNWDGPAEALAQAMAALTGYPALPSVGYATPGSFGSRYGVDAGRVVITLELPRPVPDADWPRLVAALRCATMIARGP